MKENKVILYIATSLDGYIAGEDGSVAWLDDVNGDGGDNGYGEFYNTTGAVVLGRKTYDIVLTLADEFPYKGKPCYVLTSSTDYKDENAIFTNENLETLIPRLKEEAEGDVYIVGGGELVKSCIEKNLLEELYIAIIPKVLGRGIPLFPQGTPPQTFNLASVEKMGEIVMLQYKV